MVALSGWPEPVYVAESRDWEKRRSRAGTPVQSLPPLSGEVREGVSFGSPRLNPSGGGGTGSGSRRSSVARGYPDPRYGPTAALHSRALKVVPAWSSSSSSSSSTSFAAPIKGLTPISQVSVSVPLSGVGGVGVRVTAGQRGEGLLVMRAVPDVYPPPSSGSGAGTSYTTSLGGVGGVGEGRAMTRTGSMGVGVGVGGNVGVGVGVAKEVYPRDPNNAFLWGGVGTGPGPGTGTGTSGAATPTPTPMSPGLRGSQAGDEMEVDG